MGLEYIAAFAEEIFGKAYGRWGFRYLDLAEELPNLGWHDVCPSVGLCMYDMTDLSYIPRWKVCFSALHMLRICIIESRVFRYVVVDKGRRKGGGCEKQKWTAMQV